MTHTITFPNLGWSFDIDRVAFSLFGIDFYWYGVLIGLGFMLAILYAMKRGKQFGLNPDTMIDVVFGATIIGIVGARLYYVAFRWEEYSGDLKSILDLRSGGLAIYGGIIFGFLAGWLLGKWKKVRFLPLADAAAGGFLIAQAIGRWGNFINVEAFGSNTNLPWGMSGPTIISYLTAHEAELEALGAAIDPNMPVHPTFFYESMWCLLGFCVMQLLVKHRKFDGQLFLFYVGWYGAGRVFIEGLRTDSLLIGNTGVRVSQLVAALAVIAAVTAWLAVRSYMKKNPEALPLYCTTEESKALLEPLNKKAEEATSAEENAEVSEEVTPEESAEADSEEAES